MSRSVSMPVSLSNPAPSRRRALAGALPALAVALLAAAAPPLAAPAAAQLGSPGLGTPGSGAPIGEAELEILVKTTLLTFNDANVTGRYEVLHARLHPEFQKAFSPGRLADGFKPFRDQRIDLGLIVIYKPVVTEGPSVDARGWLGVKGHFETRPSRVLFDLAFARDRDAWKAVNIHVRVAPAGN